ncbi:heavy-metal-associated domain-containing protein [Streptomyces aurantiogriseus]|uniref:Metal associated protein n=1 Tax=Streptomyces aurantiogriseus TaxID=66870 RepID=A0A918FC21_9ACTN|nr:heavy-metal-associated domain-containing protein [Streptomyces aurantiogriseus]GGR29246.1 metal associated protein [Streptomyces aurantiogriseus]
MAEKTYTVAGMRCGRCAAGVAEKLVEVSGVTEVDVDVRAGRVTVRGEIVDGDAVCAAIDEAGYRATESAPHAAA